MLTDPLDLLQDTYEFDKLWQSLDFVPSFPFQIRLGGIPCFGHRLSPVTAVCNMEPSATLKGKSKAQESFYGEILPATRN